jgi:hypothetical protein
VHHPGILGTAVLCRAARLYAQACPGWPARRRSWRHNVPVHCILPVCPHGQVAYYAFPARPGVRCVRRVLVATPHVRAGRPGLRSTCRSTARCARMPHTVVPGRRRCLRLQRGVGSRAARQRSHHQQSCPYRGGAAPVSPPTPGHVVHFLSLSSFSARRPQERIAPRGFPGCVASAERSPGSSVAAMPTGPGASGISCRGNHADCPPNDRDTRRWR